MYATVSEPAMLPLSQPLQEGLRHHGAGRLAEAAVLYQQALESSPGDPEAFLLLGILARQARRPRQAIDLLTFAARQMPEAAHVHLNIARSWLDLGFASPQSLEEAERACRRSLALDAGNGQAWSCLASIENRRGHRDEARAAWIQALRLPRRAGRHGRTSGAGRAAYSIGILFAREGRHEDAIRVYRNGLRHAPSDARLHFACAASAASLGRRDEAISSYRRAVRLRPDFPEAFLNLGNLLYDRNDFLGSARCYARAVSLRPNYAKGWCNLGNALSALERYKAATAAYERSLSLAPETVAARHNLGNALLHEREYRRAEQCFRAALEADATSPEHHNSLGNALLQQQRTADAQSCYRRALELRPDYATAHINLANTLLYQGEHGSVTGPMMEHYRRGIELEPTNAGGQYNLSLSCLRAGLYAEGWQRHEHRWEFRELHQSRRDFRQPQWQGEPLAGATILLYAEQGLGDTLQFIRYAPLVAALGAQVILEVQPRLRRLLTGMDGIAQVLTRGEDLPAFDWHCPLMSLPLAFGTTLETIPAAVPYLRPDPALVSAAWERWPRRDDRMRVGITWAGNPSHRADHQRSLPLALFAPLGHPTHIDFYSLQYGQAAGELQHAPFPIHNASSQDKDLADTSAFISTLDLVLSIDTSIAHLTGGLGKPLWILLPHLADWRWLEGRSDSPWYPTARLFRQPVSGDWPSTVAALSAALEK
ncbi:hypothetical protein GCM10011586_03890 [Silvibacterium dinghuense]|nr:hypothetical protein GCM10011586_03890 [Silvibacterium dinghuense]